MQQWKRPLGCLLLCVLLLGLCPGAGAAADGSDIIFLALNDTMPYALSSATMPYWSGSVLYVHSATFDITSLNLSASYNAGNMTLLLYSGASKRSLTFYLADGYVQTQAGVTEEITAAMRGDQVFLPLEYCAGFFGIGVSYLTSQHGWPVVRLTTGAQVWEDVLFLEKAEKLITDRSEKYIASLTTPTTPSTPDSNPGSKPDTPSRPNEPDLPNQPDDDPAAPDEPAVLTVYPALVGVEAARAALPVLDEHKLLAAVYLTADEILSNGDLVRQLYGAGHSIGLAGDAGAANGALLLTLCRRSLMTLDQPASGCFSHYATHNNATWDSIGEDPALLALTGSDAGQILTQLLEQGAVLLPLRETTALFIGAPAAGAALLTE